VFACLSQEPVDRLEIEAAFGGLDQLPRHGREHGIEVQRLEQRPELIEVFEARRRRVAELAAQHQKRLAADDELAGRALLAQMGNVVRRLRGRRANR
jgi:hypothetical protein